jgi:glycine/D-amino acid oxidase-like deaminating enzyme
LVIGGGVVGCAATYYLARAGIDVRLVERRELNREASGTNAGNLHFQLIGAAKRIQEGGDMTRLRKVAELHARSQPVWRNLERELDADLGVRFGGGLMVAETALGLHTLELKSAIEREAGVDSRIIDGHAVREIEPALSDEIIGAIWCPGEGFANTLVVGPAFARRAIELGAEVSLHTEVTGIRHGGGGFVVESTRGPIHAKRIVNAAGARAGLVAGMVGLPLKISGRVLTVNVTEPRSRLMTTMVQHVDRRLTVKQTPSGTFIVGGGYRGRPDASGEQKLPIFGGITTNFAIASRVIPALRDVRVLRSWGGLIPLTENVILLIGEYRPVPGFYMLVADHSGFTLGPLVGRMTADLITKGHTDVDWSAFDIMDRVTAKAS